MKKLMIKINTANLWNEELQKYLLSLKGVSNITNDDIDDECIMIEYSDDTTLSIIVKEILLYLDMMKIPNIRYFNKYMETKLDKYEFNIEHLCCEYCLSSNIEELLYVDGISEVYTNFNNMDKYNILVSIYYDKTKINEEQLYKIEEKFKK